MSVVLIGMPSSGKSTVGVILAKRLGLKFVDTDLLIQEQQGQLLCELIARMGPEGFSRLENELLAKLCEKDAVISTGGSAVYCREGMKNLKTLGRVVYLDISYGEMVERLGDYEHRGIVMKQGQTLADIYAERQVLYSRYADVTVCAENRSISKTVDEIISKL